jgi:hypothetical protein
VGLSSAQFWACAIAQLPIAMERRSVLIGR